MARKARGDCYEAAAIYMINYRDDSDLRLVHGEVAGQGPLQGLTLGHAWVEDGDMVIDQSNGRDVHMPKWLYYQIGKIDSINNIHRYTFVEMRDRCLGKTNCTNAGTYGPWELEVSQSQAKCH
jgi:hypothetical protein